jgi:hypothetical protein
MLAYPGEILEILSDPNKGSDAECEPMDEKVLYVDIAFI